MDPLFQEPSVMTTVGESFHAGGFMMWPILGCSVVVVGLALERYSNLRASRALPQTVRDAVEQIGDGRSDAVDAQIRDNDSPAARVLAAGLRRRGFPLADVERAMEDQVRKEGARLRSNIRGITLMAAVAPLCGLLGTVIGIATSFAAIQKQGLDKAESLAAGIGVALYTTIFGLIVAIPATILAAHLQSRVRRIMLLLDGVLSPAIEPLAAAAAATGSKAAAPSKDETHAA